MRIAEVAPLYESVPPKLYGGTERVVSYLTEALVAAGHDVTLFAAGDSETRARLVPMCSQGLRLSGTSDSATVAWHVRMVEEVYRQRADFDGIHFHIDHIHFPLFCRSNKARLSTLHGRLDLPELQPLYRSFADEPLVSISKAQRTPLPWAAWQGTIYHGLPAHLLDFCAGPAEYLAFVGRISPEKRPDRAIEVARRVGIPLKIAAKVAAQDQEYFDRCIKPLMDPGIVEFVGEIGEHEKGRFLGRALALLFLIDWPEPFGLVMIEAMACGTPVIAFGHGSVPEIVDDGVNGFVVDSCDGAVAAIDEIARVDRLRCRQRFEERFLASRMAANYVDLLARQLGAESRHPLVCNS